MDARIAAVDHLLLRLRPLNRALRAAVKQQSEIAAGLFRPDVRALCVTDNQVLQLLDSVDERTRANSQPGITVGPSREETKREQRLRDEAARCSIMLPLDCLVRCLGLTPFEENALVLCTAPELDRAYERIFAYILDDLNRRYPCVELICRLTAGSTADELKRRVAVGRYGRLRRCGLLEAFGEATTEIRTQLRLAPGVLEFLLGESPRAAGLWRDPAKMTTATTLDCAASNGEKIERLTTALRDGSVEVVGVWSRFGAAVEEAATAMATAAQLPLRRLALDRWLEAEWARSRIHDELVAAATRNAAILVPVGPLHDAENRRTATWLAEVLAACGVPVILAGVEPWRPTALLCDRAYAEIDLPAPSYAERQAMWTEAIPEADRAWLADVSARFRMSRREMDAVSRVAELQERLRGNGALPAIDATLDEACAIVARKEGGRFAQVVTPRRGPEDLILPPALHRQVMEIAHFTRAMPRVAERWGFGRLASGGAGLKVLFTGPPGTGKTLAAEVIAGTLRMPLLKVSIGQTLSKWIGETEKNLDEVFREGESSHAVLFFDEADALFGKRGEVRHGVDRYANTEISHLLQRVEDHEGLVILASNLKQNIDSAFQRRFHIVIQFPRPPEAERRRLWRIAFPAEAPLGDDVNLEGLVRLDMTGAGIVGAARTAAMLAASEGESHVTMGHVVHGIARQYQRESRVLTPAELGRYAQLLQERP